MTIPALVIALRITKEKDSTNLEFIMDLENKR